MDLLATAVQGHLFWITSRAAGTVALLFSSLSTGVGLTLGLRLLGRRVGDVRVAHEALSLATLAALAVHAGALLGDDFIGAGVADVTIPFAAGFGEPWLGLGIIGGWGLVVLGLAYYARARIGVRRWRTAHRFTALFWLLGLVHALGEGSDAGTAWFLVAVAVVAVPALALLAVRLRPPARAERAATA